MSQLTLEVTRTDDLFCYAKLSSGLPWHFSINIFSGKEVLTPLHIDEIGYLGISSSAPMGSKLCNNEYDLEKVCEVLKNRHTLFIVDRYDDSLIREIPYYNGTKKCNKFIDAYIVLTAEENEKIRSFEADFNEVIGISEYKI